MAFGIFNQNEKKKKVKKIVQFQWAKIKTQQ